MLAFCSSDEPDLPDRDSGSFLCALLLWKHHRIVKIWDQTRLPIELAFFFFLGGVVRKKNTFQKQVQVAVKRTQDQ